MEKISNSPEETYALGKLLGGQSKPGQVYCLDGDLGVGKTIFTQGFAAGLGIDEPVNSPTFTIVQQYDSGRLPLYHFDVYRIGDVSEMDEIGYEDCFYGEGVCLIEWSQLIPEILPDEVIRIRIEKDLEFCVYAEPDFITIDGRGGATGASPQLVRDATSVPTVYALHRARKYLDQVQAPIDLVITGGLRVSSDFAKALAMGADAVAVATAPMIAAACQQYRICGTGMCPVGIATQDEQLRSRLQVEAAGKRVENYLRVTLEELKTFARITGHRSVHDLNLEDLCTISKEISEYTDIVHA